MKKTGIKRFLLITLLFIMLLPIPVFAKTTIRIAVADTSKYMARSTIRYLKKCGMTGYQIKSSNVNPYMYDGLVIPGGGDVTPSIYREKKSRRTRGCSISKDKLQIAAVLKFANAGKPVLGICRGCQVINVAFGGTLKQHVGYRNGRKTVKLKTESVFYSTFHSSVKLYHCHHQAAEKPGRGILFTMFNSDKKVVEGLQHETLPVYGVQCHPERSGHAGLLIGKKFKAICEMYKNAAG